MNSNFIQLFPSYQSFCARHGSRSGRLNCQGAAGMKRTLSYFGGFQPDPEIAMLSVPIYLIWDLQMSVQRKMGISATFFGLVHCNKPINFPDQSSLFCCAWNRNNFVDTQSLHCQHCTAGLSRRTGPKRRLYVCAFPKPLCGRKPSPSQIDPTPFAEILHVSASQKSPAVSYVAAL